MQGRAHLRTVVTSTVVPGWLEATMQGTMDSVRRKQQQQQQQEEEEASVWLLQYDATLRYEPVGWLPSLVAGWAPSARSHPMLRMHR